MNQDEFYMRKALKLAEGGIGKTNPNPLVGAVIVKQGEVVAEGFHEVLGCAHAEVAAFNSARKDVAGGTLYVNLEPCSHYGRTPPCAKAIIEKGIQEVVIAMEDPNPKVSGKGIHMLQEAGITVRVGVLEGEARKLNEIFIKFISRKSPFVILKTAMTLDGKIAAGNGDSKWVTGKEARQYVHSVRNRVSAIMVGIGTVLADNPSLTTRLETGAGRDPQRIIVDSRGIIPEDSQVLSAESKAGVILATTNRIGRDKEQRLGVRGVRVLKLTGEDGRVDLKRLMEELYKLEIDSVLLEGGGTLNASALEVGIVDKVMCFIAPKILGGRDAPTPVEGKGASAMSEAIALMDTEIRKIGSDFLIEGYV